MQGTVDSEAEGIIRGIHEAFVDVPRGCITLHEAEVIDEYGSDDARVDARKLDTDGRWEDVPDSHVEECTTALCHVDPESWRYYIAPYMVWSLRHLRTNDSIVSDFTIYSFDPSSDDPRLYAYSMDRFRLLDEKQSAIVCRFLRYMASKGDYADERVAHEALQKYWSTFCPADIR
ncbi:MAG: DUF6714 family protein [Pirellulales bacterium]